MMATMATKNINHSMHLMNMAYEEENANTAGVALQ
jgi:hypothetical protein